MSIPAASIPADTAPVGLHASDNTARTLDKFYTKSAVARQCIAFFETCSGIELSKSRADILEPSAGAGAFLDHLPDATLAYDLAPEDPRVERQDFLGLTREAPAIVIGNPPFGKASRLAVKFFNHAAGFASHIAFIVPRTFEKSSVQNRLDRSFSLIGQMPLKRDSFTFAGESYAVPCAFQVWARTLEQRPVITLPRVHPDFSFVRREAADFAFQRVGVRAGTVKVRFEAASAASHHFIRSNVPLESLLSRFAEIDFSDVKARTAGNPSISKTELVALYTEAARRR